MPEFAGIPEQLVGSLQENVVTLAASSDQYCKLVMLNVPLQLYSNRVVRDLATQIYEFVRNYGKAPKDHLVDLVEDKLDGEDGEMLQQILENIHALQKGFNEVYVVNQLAKFVRQQHLKNTVVDIIEAAEKGDTDRADDVLEAYRKTSFEQFSPGLRLKEFASELGRTEKVDTLVPLGIKELDQVELGPSRGEFHLFMAPPKRGKTFWLLHVAKQALLARRRTVYITLEVSPQIIAGRFMQSLFAMTRRDTDKATSGHFDVDANGKLVGIRVEELGDRMALTSAAGMAKVKKTFRSGSQISRLSENLIIQGFPTGQLRLKELSAYLENLSTFHRFTPDVVILDMINLMHIDLKNYRLALGLMAKDLRGLAVERNFAFVTATPSNRASLKARTITETHTGEDISLMSIADVGITYNQTQEEKDMQVARLHVAVARNSPDKWSLCISQAYGLGQFYTGSAVANQSTLEKLLPRSRTKGQDADYSEEEEEDDDSNER